MLHSNVKKNAPHAEDANPLNVGEFGRSDRQSAEHLWLAYSANERLFAPALFRFPTVRHAALAYGLLESHKEAALPLLKHFTLTSEERAQFPNFCLSAPAPGVARLLPASLATLLLQQNPELLLRFLPGIEVRDRDGEREWIAELGRKLPGKAIDVLPALSRNPGISERVQQILAKACCREAPFEAARNNFLRPLKIPALANLLLPAAAAQAARSKSGFSKVVHLLRQLSPGSLVSLQEGLQGAGEAWIRNGGAAPLESLLQLSGLSKARRDTLIKLYIEHAPLDALKRLPLLEQLSRELLAYSVARGIEKAPLETYQHAGSIQTVPTKLRARLLIAVADRDPQRAFAALSRSAISEQGAREVLLHCAPGMAAKVACALPKAAYLSIDSKEEVLLTCSRYDLGASLSAASTLGILNERFITAALVARAAVAPQESMRKLRELKSPSATLQREVVAAVATVAPEVALSYARRNPEALLSPSYLARAGVRADAILELSTQCEINSRLFREHVARHLLSVDLQEARKLPEYRTQLTRTSLPHVVIASLATERFSNGTRIASAMLRGMSARDKGESDLLHGLEQIVNAHASKLMTPLPTWMTTTQRILAQRLVPEDATAALFTHFSKGPDPLLAQIVTRAASLGIALPIGELRATLRNSAELEQQSEIMAQWLAAGCPPLSTRVLVEAQLHAHGSAFEMRNLIDTYAALCQKLRGGEMLSSSQQRHPLFGEAVRSTFSAPHLDDGAIRTLLRRGSEQMTLALEVQNYLPVLPLPFMAQARTLRHSQSLDVGAIHRLEQLLLTLVTHQREGSVTSLLRIAMRAPRSDEALAPLLARLATDSKIASKIEQLRDISTDRSLRAHYLRISTLYELFERDFPHVLGAVTRSSVADENRMRLKALLNPALSLLREEHRKFFHRWQRQPLGNYFLRPVVGRTAALASLFGGPEEIAFPKAAQSYLPFFIVDERTRKVQGAVQATLSKSGDALIASLQPTLALLSEGERQDIVDALTTQLLFVARTLKVPLYMMAQTEEGAMSARADVCSSLKDLLGTHEKPTIPMILGAAAGVYPVGPRRKSPAPE